MKRIIALYRRGGTGKTGTLNLVIDLLQVAATGCPMPPAQPTGHNRRATIRYKGQIISVCTAGDDEAQLLVNQTYFEAQKCDVAITASRTKGKTVVVIQNMQLKHKESTPEVFYFTKYQQAFPKSLFDMGSECPPILACLGNTDLLTKQKIGFCGSREATEKGLDVTKDISQQVSDNNVVVVSGYASGIDQQAHYWSLKNNGATIIVLPEGINGFRIKKHLKSVWDWNRVLVLSEFTPNAIWSVNRAMQRNSTIIGLSDVMVLIEAKEKGGSIDAGYKTLKMNKILFAPVYEGMPVEASGNSLLLHKGALPIRKKRESGLANLDLLFHYINEGQRPNKIFDLFRDIK